MRYDARMFKDEAPRVVIAEPKTDRDVPADAMIPVRVELDDDFGLHSARLIYKVADRGLRAARGRGDPALVGPERRDRRGLRPRSSSIRSRPTNGTWRR